MEEDTGIATLAHPWICLRNLEKELKYITINMFQTGIYHYLPIRNIENNLIRKTRHLIGSHSWHR